MKKTSKLIIYLDRQKLIFCSSLVPQAVLDLPTSVVFDLEIIDPESFENLLNSFLEVNQINPSECIIVLSSAVYFEKDYPPTSDTEIKKTQAEAFLATIPHKNIFQKEFIIDNQLKLIAINKDFYEPIIRYFEKKHFNVNAIIPIFVLDYLKLILVEYSPKEVREIYKKFKNVISYSLVSAQEINKSMAVNTYHPIENKNRTIALVVTFSLLFAILLLLLFVRPYFIKQSYTKQLQKSLALLPTGNPQKPTLAPTPSITATPTYLATENIRLHIINSSGVTNQAAKFRELLISSGFQKITTATANKTVGEKLQISYSSSVSSDSLQKVIIGLGLTSDQVLSKQVDSLPNFDIIVNIVAKPGV